MSNASVAALLKNSLPDEVVTVSTSYSSAAASVLELATLYGVTPLAVTATKYTQEIVNLRTQPVVGLNNLIKQLPQNTSVEITNLQVTPLNPADGHDWVYVRAAGSMGYLAGEYLGNSQATVTPVTPPAPTLITGGVGLHIGSGGGGQYNEWAQTYAPHKQLAIAVVVDNVPLANDILAKQQARIVVARAFSPNGDDGKTVPSDPVQATAFADQWINDRIGLFNGLDKRAFVQVGNEWSYTPGHNAYWIQVLNRLHTLGYRCAMGAYAVGQPEPAQWATMAPALALCKQYGGIVGLHVYSAPGTPAGQLSKDATDYELRPMRLYAAVGAASRPQLAFFETGNVFGGTSKVSGPDLVSFMHELLDTYHGSLIPEIADPPAAVWTLDTFKPWTNASVEGDLSYIATI